MRHINAAGLAIIKKAETCSLSAYLCPAGVPTIGWGSTRDVHLGMKITATEADERLLSDLRDAEDDVNRLVKVALTDNQFSALVSFVYNIGSGNFQKSGLLKKLNSGSYTSVPGELGKWTRGGGKKLLGLVIRRAAEGGLFLRL